MEHEWNDSQDLYLASRPDSLDPKTRLFLSDRLTWTKNQSLARRGSLASMNEIVQKIMHAYPELSLEKDEV